MSDLVGASLVFFLGTMGFFCFFYISKMTSDIGEKILTGIREGNAIPTSTRWYLLHTQYAPYASGAVSAGVFLALAQLQMAKHVEDPGVEFLAHMAAFIAAVGGTAWLVNGAAEFFHYRSVLRQAEAD
jgi:hypothetical protein